MAWLSPEEVAVVPRATIELEYEGARRDADTWMTRYYTSCDERNELWRENKLLHREVGKAAAQYLRECIASRQEEIAYGNTNLPELDFSVAIAALEEWE